VISEQGRCFVGVYDGEHAPKIVTDALFQSDAILALGCTYGRQYRKLLNDKIGVFLHAADDQFRKGGDAAVAANLKRLVTALNAAPWTPKPEHSHGRLLPGPGFADRRARSSTRRAELPGAGLGYNALMDKVSEFLDAGFISMTDTSLCQYPGADMNIPAKNAYVCNAIWNAIGYTPPAAIGIGLAEKDTGSNRRPLVICGDGGFQMTAQALSTLARNNIRAIVIILDNALYAIEEYVINQSGGYFSNAAVPITEHLKLARWDYVMLAKALGINTAQKVDTLADFAQALQTAKSAQGPAVISVTMNPRSLPSELFS
jgi:indolepyruvate decarboxylase